MIPLIFSVLWAGNAINGMAITGFELGVTSMKSHAFIIKKRMSKRIINALLNLCTGAAYF
jgi:hypothetical protein